MLDGLYSAAAGMEAQQEQIDALANDVSNVSTPGYQATRVDFHDLLYTSGGPAATARPSPQAPGRRPTSSGGARSRAHFSRPVARWTSRSSVRVTSRSGGRTARSV